MIIYVRGLPGAPADQIIWIKLASGERERRERERGEKGYKFILFKSLLRPHEVVNERHFVVMEKIKKMYPAQSIATFDVV